MHTNELLQIIQPDLELNLSYFIYWYIVLALLVHKFVGHGTRSVQYFVTILRSNEDLRINAIFILCSSEFEGYKTARRHFSEALSTVVLARFCS